MSRTPTWRGPGRQPLLMAMLPVLISAVALGACRGGGEEKRASDASDGAESLPRALALGLALFEKSPEGKQVPQPATAAFLVREGGSWQ